jgi:dihydroxyacid dehydratase/phosphogluconate dehydratase
VALNRRSHVITDGDARAANRSMLYPVGFSAADFGKPIVGVPHGHSTMTPCNAGIQSLVDRAIDALKAAGRRRRDDQAGQVEGPRPYGRLSVRGSGCVQRRQDVA